MKVVRVRLPLSDGIDDESLAELLLPHGLLGSAALHGEQGAALELFFETDEGTMPDGLLVRLSATPAGALADLTVAEASAVEPADWLAVWKESFHAVRAGPFVIHPPWEPYPPGPGEIAFGIDPGLAFGTGHHETTRLCLELIAAEAGRGDPGGRSLIDVGSGTGILAMAAWKIGFRPVWQTDNDPEAERVAAINVAANGCSGIRTSPSGLRAGRTFDLVVANILPSALLEIRPRLLEMGGQRTRWILSGILNEELDRFAAAFVRGRLRELGRRRLGEWAALLVEGS